MNRDFISINLYPILCSSSSWNGVVLVDMLYNTTTFAVVPTGWASVTN